MEKKYINKQIFLLQKHNTKAFIFSVLCNKLLIVFFFAFSVFSAFAQNQQKVDSLKNILKSASEDTSKVNTLILLSDEFAVNLPDTALKYATISLGLAEKINFKKGSAKLYNKIGNILEQQGGYEKAMEYYQKALKIYEKSNDKKRVASCYNNMAIVQYRLGKFNIAINYYQKAMQTFNDLGAKSEIAICLCNIGVLYSDQGKYSFALEYYQKALAIDIDLGDKKGMAIDYNNIATIYERLRDYNKAIENLQKALKLFEELDYKDGMSAFYKNIGQIYQNQGNYLEALEYYHLALKIEKELGDKKGMAKCLYGIGSVYDDQGKYALSMQYYQISIRIYQEIKAEDGILSCILGIGCIHKKQKYYKKAIEYYKKALSISKKIGDDNGTANCYINIGSVYFEQKKFSIALYFYKKSHKIYAEIGDKDGVSACYTNFGNIETEQGNYSEAIKWYEKTLIIHEELKDKQGISLVYNNLSLLKINVGKYSEAIEYAKKSLEIAKEIGSLDDEKSSYQYLAVAYDSLRNEKGALKYYKLFIKAQDSLFNSEKHKQIAELETKYQTEQKQKEIVLQKVQLEKNGIEIKQQRLLKFIFMIGLAMVLLFLITVILLLQKSRKQQKQIAAAHEKLKKATAELIESEKKSFIADMVAGLAHDLKTPVGNAMLSSDTIKHESVEIEKMIKERSLTEARLQGFNRITFETGERVYTEMQRISEWIKGFQTISADQVRNESKTINLKEYLETCMKTLDFKLGMKKIFYSVNGPGDLMVHVLPGFISQTVINLINNAVEHGFEDFEIPEKKIELFVGKNEGNVFFECRNNGRLIPPDILPKIFDEYFSTKHGIKGMGLSSVKRIVEQGLGGNIYCKSSINEWVDFKVQFPDKQNKQPN